jgi:hypothetical protein
MALRIAFGNNQRPTYPNCDFEVRIFVVNRSIHFPVDHAIPSLDLCTNDRQREKSTFDRKRRRSGAKEQDHRKQDPAGHLSPVSIPSWHPDMEKGAGLRPAPVMEKSETAQASEKEAGVI